MNSQSTLSNSPLRPVVTAFCASLLLIFAPGCGDDAAGGGFDGYGGDYGTTPPSSGKTGGDKPASTSDKGAKEPSEGPGEVGEQPQPVNASQLTAGEWDDNLNFGLFTKYVDEAMKSDGQLPDMKTTGRVLIRVVDSDEKPVPAARVQ